MGGRAVGGGREREEEVAEEREREGGFRKQQDDLVSIVLSEALAQRFTWFGESDVHPR